MRDNGFEPSTSVPFPLTPETYFRSASDPLQNAQVAGGATWGALFSSDEFAVLAGSKSFLDEFETRLQSNYEQQTIAFLRDRKRGHEQFGFGVEWIPPLVRRLFGFEHGARLLAATDFDAEDGTESSN